MSNKKHALGLGVVVLGLSCAGSASADYTGVYGGGSAALFNALELDLDNNSGTRASVSAEDAFTRVGLIAGAGAQYGQVYYGLDGTFTLVNDLDEKVLEDGSTEINLEGDDRWSFGARLGYVTPSNDTLFYGKVAFVGQTLELSTDSGSGDEDFEGVGVGIGAEYMPSDNVSLRAEAMRVSYSDETVQGVDFEPTENTVDLAILYHF